MRLRPDKQSSDITEPITDHTSLGPPGLPPASRPIRMSGSIGRRVEDLSARLTDLALLLVGTPARERQRTRARYIGALAGWNTPELSASSSARMTCTTALISARWVNACGKLPRCRPVRGSISSAYRCSGLANDSSRSHRCLARLDLADLDQRRHQPERADGEGALLAGQAVVGLLDAIPQHQPLLGQLVGDGQHRRA